MGAPTDEELLTGDAAAFGAFYRRHVRAVVAFFGRRTAGAEVAADLTAETFAAALAGRDRFDPTRGEPRAWLFGIAHRQLVDYRRRGAVEERGRRRLGMERLVLDDEQLAQVEAAVQAEGPSAALLLDELASPSSRSSSWPPRTATTRRTAGAAAARSRRSPPPPRSPRWR